MKKIVFLLVISFLWWKESQSQNQTMTAPAMKLSVEQINYGIVLKGTNDIRTFKVSNIGSAPLVLMNCSASCGCTVPTCPKEPIMPGKFAEISVKYNTTIVGSIHKMVTITSNDPKKASVNLNVIGEVKESF